MKFNKTFHFMTTVCRNGSDILPVSCRSSFHSYVTGTDSQPSHYISCKVHSMTDGSHQIVLISVYRWIHLRLILETFMLKIVTLHRQNRLCWLDLRIHHCKNEQSEGENMYDELNYTSTAKHKHEPWFYVMSQSKVLIHQQKKVSTDSSN